MPIAEGRCISPCSCSIEFMLRSDRGTTAAMMHHSHGERMTVGEPDAVRPTP
jgi:hypothetical protein